MHLNKKHTTILFVLFILSFGLSFAFLKYRDSQSIDSTNLGVETLADADYYETISEHKPENITPSELETPKITKDLESPINGFSIKTSQREIFGNVYVEVRFEDGTYSDKLVVLESDARAEEDPADIFFSDLFTFSQKISEINAYYNGDYQFEILIVDNEAQDNLGLGDSVTADTSAFYSTEAAELEYKEKFLNAINLNIIPREDWGAPTISMWENPLVYNADRIVVHHTATGVDADPAVTVKAIYNDHAYNRGWLDIGYNYLIAPNGAIYEGRAGGNGVRGAHAIPNSNTIGISMLGNYQDQQPTTAAISSLQKLIGVLAKFNDIDMVYRSGTYAPSADRPSGVYPHATYNSDYPTACPGQNLRNIMPQIVENAKAYKNYRPQVSATADEANELTSNREVQKDGEYVEVMVDTTGLSSLMKEKLKTESRGVTSYRELGDTIIYKVEEDKVKQVVAETKLVAPTTKAQPNFIYKTSEGWVDDGTNAYPDNTAPDNDYDASVHWNLEKINMPEAWHELGGCTAVDDNTCGGDSSVVIAVLDTGVAYEDHNYDAGTDYYTTKIGGLYLEIPATNPGGAGYTPTYNEGYDRQYYQSPELDNSKFVHPYDAAQEYLCALRASDGNTSTDCNTTELAKRYRANDDHGHGTFVTSIIAANVDDTGRNLVTGMAHNVNIMPVKVFLPNDRSMCQDGSGNLDETCSNSYYDYRTVATSYTLVRGIEHAVDNGADVINMSLTGLGSDPYVEAAINEATAANTVVVAAAGNYDSDIANYFPASFENVIAVGATDEGDNKASYSNYGDELDIVAPVGDSGQIIASHTYSCYPSKNNCSDETNPNIFQSFYDVNEDDGNTMAKNIGTSFAAPQVAAAAGLLKYQAPNSTVADIKTALYASATDINTSGFDNTTGFGILDIQSALTEVNNLQRQYFTWYDNSKITRPTWILVGNPSTTETITVNINISNNINRTYQIPPEGRITPSFGGVKNGPVIVTSPSEFYATQRTVYEGSFNEYESIDENDLDTTYYFPWYDSITPVKFTWILIGNPSSTQDANVNIQIADEVNENYVISPGGSITPIFPGIQNGPVTITSDINIYTTQRTLYNNSFNEFSGIPAQSLTTDYYFTWYDSTTPLRYAWIVVANPSSTETANVNIKIADGIDDNYIIAPGDRITPIYTSIQDGPVTISSDINVYATQRTTYQGSFNEYSAIGSNTLTNQYNYTWYDTSQTDRQSWILVGNPSTTETANITIKVADNVNQNYVIPPGDRVVPHFDGIKNGPVIITSDINVYSSQRTFYEGSFNEYPGIK